VANDACVNNVFASRDSSQSPKVRRHRWVRPFLALTWFLGPSVAVSRAQTYLQSTGTPTFTTALPIEDGFINASNGNLHLTIPVETLPQRGGRPLQIMFAYDSAMWEPGPYNNAWFPGNINGDGGGPWRLFTTDDSGFLYVTDTPGRVCSLDGGVEYDIYTFYNWTSSEGTSHAFSISTHENWPTQCIPNPGPGTPNASGYATDATGFYMSVTNYTNAVVYAPDGTVVYSSTSAGIEDPNGNNAARSLDTVGRTPVTTTISGNLIYYDIPDSRGSTRRYTVTTESINVNTAL